MLKSKFKVGDKVYAPDIKSGYWSRCVTVSEIEGGTERGYPGQCIIWAKETETFCPEHMVRHVSPQPIPPHYDTILRQTISDGGPSDYYNFPSEWNTFNDFIEYKSLHQWKEHSFHLGNIGKAICRWGDKDGATKEYDAKKIVYSALRVLLMLKGKSEVQAYLQKLINDPQFKD